MEQQQQSSQMMGQQRQMGQPMPNQGGFPPQGYPMQAGEQLDPNAALAYQQQMAMMQQQQMQGQNPGFFQQRGQPQLQGVGPNNQQYRAKQPGLGGFPQQQNQGRMQGMPSGLGMGGLPGALLDVGKMQGLMNGSAPQGQSSGVPKVKRDPASSLYVGNLPNTTFELDLFKFFSSRGYKLKNARVMFDEGNRSRGYGYLNFHDAAEATRCLNEMNNSVMSGKQIVLNKQKDREFDSQANLLVRNLPKSLDQRGLAELFGKYGKIGSCKLEIFNDGTSRGFGYVQFDSADDAKKAIQSLNDKVVDGQTITVLVHSKRDERETQAERYTNLYLQNLPERFTAGDLTKEFSQFGTIASVVMGTKPGHGYVSFKNHDDAQKALEAVNMKLKLDDKTVLCSPHVYKKESDLQPKGSNANPIVQNQKQMFKSNIYVRYIPKDVTKEELEAEFSKAGQICSTKIKEFKIKSDLDDKPAYQIAYVLYSEVKDAQKCIRMFDQSRPFGGSFKPLKVDFWQAKQDLKQERDEKSQNYIRQILNLCKQSSNGPRGYHQQQQQFGGGAPTQGYPDQGNQYMQQDGGQHQQQQYQQQRQGGRGGFGNQQRGRGGRGGGRGQHQGGGRGNYNNQKQGRGGGQGYNQHQQHRGGHEKPQQQQFQQQPGQGPTGQPVLPHVDIAQLEACATPEERENFVGNSIYNAIYAAFGEHEAPTITGMILDESAVDYKELLSNSSYFVNKVNEARAVLKQSQQADMQQQTPHAPQKQ